MKMTYLQYWMLAAVAALVATPADVQAAAMGTAFTYQGRVEFSGSAVTDTCDFDFSLWDAPTGGAMIGPLNTRFGVGVEDGLFTVNDLDFGPDAFNGEARWLLMAVCCPSPGCGMQPLSPRQEMTPAPHALALPGLYTQQTGSGHNLIGGYSGNSVAAGVEAGTVGGGGVPGFPNRVTDFSGTVGGGDNNTAGSVDGDPMSATNATVGGGGENAASGQGATVGGGFYNTAGANGSTIGGGSSNKAYDDFGTVAGGVDNEAGSDDGDPGTATNATVGGGNTNKASAALSTVGGGLSNTASADLATVGGGYVNTASGDAATVPGGEANTAGGAYSFAAGQRAQANHFGTFVWSDGTTVDPDFFASTGDNQFLIKAAGGVGINTETPPGAALHIADTGRAGWDGIMFQDGSVQTSAYTGAAGGGYWSPDGNNIYSTNSENVGIGTTTPDPSHKLDVVSDSTGTAANAQDAPSAVTGHMSTTNDVINNGVLGISDSPSGNGVTGYASSATGGAWGVAGITESSGGAGVAGIAQTSPGWGVYGKAAGEGRGVFGEGVDGAGVSGWVSGTTGFNVGVRGATSSPDGAGGLFYNFATTGQAPGVQGFTDSNDDGASAIRGDAMGASGSTVGVVGASMTSPIGVGVDGMGNGTGGRFTAFGSSSAKGVMGHASNNSGTNYGVYGKTDSPDGYGGYFEGRGYFSGNVGIGAGATTPSEALDVDGNVRASGDVIAQAVYATDFIQVGVNSLKITEESIGTTDGTPIIMNSGVSLEPTSDCCSSHAGTGCGNLTCETAVCALRPSCCSTSWDSICATNALTACETICGPMDLAVSGTLTVADSLTVGKDSITKTGGDGPLTLFSSCCVARLEAGGGCDDETCEDTVCAIDAFCCDESEPWEASCVSLAESLCGGLCDAKDVWVSGDLKIGSSITIDGELDTISASSGKINFTDDQLVNIAKLGIGTPTPLFALDAKGSVFRFETTGFSGPSIEMVGDDTSNVSIGFCNQDGPCSWIFDDDSDAHTFKISAPEFAVNIGGANEALRIDSDKNVGIGTDTPLTPLHVGSGLSMSASALASETVLIEAEDAQLTLASSDAGNFGSSIALKEISGGALVDTWGLVRESAAFGSDLRLTYGSNEDPSSNQEYVYFNDAGQMRVGGGGVNEIPPALIYGKVTVPTHPNTRVGIYGQSTDIVLGNYIVVPGLVGVLGQARSSDAEERKAGIYGSAMGLDGVKIGVMGVAESAGGTNWGGYFVGDVHVEGDLEATGTKPFKIDHPLDPENRYLYHYAMESPEVLNLYRGTVVLDAVGEGRAELPSYFQSINRDFTYQLTAVGAPMPNLHVAKEIDGKRFKIAGGKAGMKVSWQVTGVRNDPYVRKYGAPVEVEKPEPERGFYQHPELYGQPEERGVNSRHRVHSEEPNPEAAQRREEAASDLIKDVENPDAGEEGGVR